MSEIQKHDHLLIETPPTVIGFSSVRSFGAEFRSRPRNRATHGELLESQWRAIWAKHDEDEATKPHIVALPAKDGIYVHFEGAPDCNLKIDSLEDKRQGIVLLNAMTHLSSDKSGEHEVENAVVYVPNNKRNSFLKKIEDYVQSEPSEKGTFKNQKLMESIEKIRFAFWDSMWTGRPEDRPQDTPLWCEVWLRNDKRTVVDANVENVTRFFEVCAKLNIAHKNQILFFPERNVCMIKANAEQLQQLMDNSDFIAEFRRAPETAEFFVEQNIAEQKEWVNELCSRLKFTSSNATICVLDTGLNNGHPLLKDVTDDRLIQTVNETWGAADRVGHGTEMCGVATFFDLQACLESDKPIEVAHRIESVKIIPDGDSDANDPELYGDITRQAIYLSEIENPQVNKVICLAITSDKYNTDDGSPTSWSAEIDNISSGAHDGSKRLVFISAGNVYTSDQSASGGYPVANRVMPINSPGQSWNAVTVGAYSASAPILEGTGYQVVAPKGALSPYSTTSIMWDSKWPIKPEILCDGGNMISDGQLYSESDATSLLTTAHNIQERLFTTIWGTSSATAQASNIAARIYEKYPNFWPETVRAMMIHAASWTEDMIAMCDATNKTKRGNLLRTCGYGIPSLERALYTLNSRVNMIIQGELSPYTRLEDQRIGTNEMHIYELPWPKEELLSLGDMPITMRITLSYFIEPGPGAIGWKDRYRYPSCLLRFDLKNKNEDVEDFKKRINRAARDDEKDSGDGSSGSERWYLGKKNRDVGSIHSDIWTGTAADLSQCNHIGIFPAIGWWKERKYLNCYQKKIRYSLVVSLESPDTEIDLYTPIKIQITPPVVPPIAHPASRA